jgi:hypothetical protein
LNNRVCVKEFLIDGLLTISAIGIGYTLLHERAILYINQDDPKIFAYSIWVFGFLLMLYAKISQYKKGDYCTIGARKISKQLKKNYWIGISLSIVGIGLMLY